MKKKNNVVASSCYSFYYKINLLQDPDSMRTGTNGRDAADVFGCTGIFIGVDRAALDAPISTDSTSMWANELLQNNRYYYQGLKPEIIRNLPAWCVVGFEYKLWSHPQATVWSSMSNNLDL